MHACLVDSIESVLNGWLYDENIESPSERTTFIQLYPTRFGGCFSSGIYFSVLARILPFPSFRRNFTIFRYSPGFYHFHLLTLIQPVCGTRSDSFPVLPRILPFPSFRRNFTIFRYSPGFYHFHLLTRIQPFSGTRPDSFSLLGRILPFPHFRRNENSHYI